MSASAPQPRPRRRIGDLERQNLELAQTLQLVEEARSHYADHYDFAPFGCLTLDGHGCIREINVAAANLLGRERARLIAMPFLPFIEKGHLPAYLAHLRHCTRSSEKVVSELVVMAKGGIRKTVELSSVPVVDARTEQTVYRTALSDVTERRRSERALRQSEERFSKAFRASPNAIAVSSVRGARFIDVNLAFCKMTGFHRSEIIGRTAAELGIYPDRSFRDILVADLHLVPIVRNREGSLRAKSGELRDVLVSAEVIELEGDDCVLLIAQDVSDLKRLQREVLEISEREKRRIGQDLHDDACQTLAGIAMRAEVAARALAVGNPESAARVREVAQLLKNAIESVRRLASGLFPVKLERYGLAWALQELASEASERLDVQCVFTMPLRVEISGENISIHLYRIAQEAIANAARHGHAKKIEIELTALTDSARLRICDDGAGFPSDAETSGVGLHSMHYRARLIGGNVSIDPNKRKGTVVTCSFPYHRPPPRRRRHENIDIHNPGSRAEKKSRKKTHFSGGRPSPRA